MFSNVNMHIEIKTYSEKKLVLELADIEVFDISAYSKIIFMFLGAISFLKKSLEMGQYTHFWNNNLFYIFLFIHELVPQYISIIVFHFHSYC